MQDLFRCRPPRRRFGGAFALTALFAAFTLVLHPAVFVPAAQAASTIFVDADATGTDDGSSWANAFVDLQDALDAAESDDEIWVAEGVYLPDTTDRGVSFELENNVAIYGGFTGVETLRAERNPNPMTNNTVLSGDIGIAGDMSDNSNHVVFAIDIDDNAILDGFTIRDGNANASGDNDGGGLYSEDSALTLRHLIFVANASSDNGGGMYHRKGETTLVGVKLIGNTAEDGGGMYIDGTTMALFSVLFSGNTASDTGGGLHSENSEPTLTNSTFVSNNADDEGGGIFSNSSPVLIQNAILLGNTSSDPDIDDQQIKGGTPTVTNSIVDGVNTIDPLFADPDGADDTPGTLDDDLRLLPGSPAIDQGDNSLLPADTMDADGDSDTTESMPFDLGGNPRVVNTTVDLGAYEAQGFSFTITSGDNQNTLIDTPFDEALEAQVVPEVAGEPVTGGVVTFAAPDTGASTVPVSGTLTIDSSGVVSTTVAANAITGTYTLDFSTIGETAPGMFNLENTLPALSIDDVTVVESDGTATFTVTLATASDQNVSVDYATADDTATAGSDYVAIASTTLMIPTGTLTQTIVVDISDDTLAEGTESFVVNLENPVNATIDKAQGVGTISDDDLPAGVTVTETDDGTAVSEDGDTDTYSLVLDKEPTADVVITLTSDDQVTAAPTTLTFTSANWNISQTVTVAAVDDDVVEEDHTGTISHSISSDDAEYAALTLPTITVSITDESENNGTAGVTVTETDDGTAVSEDGDTDTYSLVLDTEPTADVVITLTSDDQVTATPTTLTFTSANWDTPRTVTVAAVDDDDVEATQTGTISHSISSSDEEYAALTLPTITVSITDNDGDDPGEGEDDGRIYLPIIQR